MHSYNRVFWSLLHLLAIISILISLLTGLRIAILEHAYLLQFSRLLPQGELHTLHFFSACVFSLCAISYLVLRIRGQVYSLSNVRKRNRSIRYHLLVGRLLYVICLVSITSGWVLFAENVDFNKSLLLFLHYMAALFFILYLLLHAGAWFIELGQNVFLRTLSPLKQFKKIRQKNSLLWLTCGLFFLIPIVWMLAQGVSQHTLVIGRIDINQRIQINGRADEPSWQQATPITVFTHGGANFENGSTPITLKALHNGAELFMHVEWDDPNESLTHLPLYKTQAGWKIQQNGFHTFNETQYYEDKLAIIIAENCDFAAAGTAHLGPQPLPDKPRHWSGQGYHYSDNRIVDLWHWKAVRTNHMRLMDDNYIGEPDIVRAGNRRYSAGYKTDARESGAYKMNWKWYSPGNVEPKRLPVKEQWLKPYQPGGDIKQAEVPWVMPWFDGEPYRKSIDTYPAGTVLPSILYTSNRFEGDRAQVHAFATWQAGKWSLELFRKLNTDSDNDIPIQDGVCLWVAAFDRSQIAHTRHVRPVKLRFQL